MAIRPFRLKGKKGGDAYAKFEKRVAPGSNFTTDWSKKNLKSMATAEMQAGLRKNVKVPSRMGRLHFKA